MPSLKGELGPVLPRDVIGLQVAAVLVADRHLRTK